MKICTSKCCLSPSKSFTCPFNTSQFWFVLPSGGYKEPLKILIRGILIHQQVCEMPFCMFGVQMKKKLTFKILNVLSYLWVPMAYYIHFYGIHTTDVVWPTGNWIKTQENLGTFLLNWYSLNITKAVKMDGLQCEADNSSHREVFSSSCAEGFMHQEGSDL